MFNLNYADFANAWRRYANGDRDGLLALGGDLQNAQLANGAFLTSLALLSMGVPLAGTQRIAEGPLTGGRAFTGANELADWLGERFAPPETIPLDLGGGVVVERFFGHRGILAFIQGSGPQGGLIGLLDGSNANVLYCAAQAKHPLEIRFWELH